MSDIYQNPSALEPQTKPGLPRQQAFRAPSPSYPAGGADSGPNPPFSISGSGLLHASLLMTSADLLALNPATFVIVPGIPGKILWPVCEYLQYKFGTTSYTATGAETAGLHYAGVDGWLDPGDFGNIHPAIDLLVKTVGISGLMLVPCWSGLFISAPDPALIVGGNLEIAAPGAGFTGGDGELKIDILYTVIDNPIFP